MDLAVPADQAVKINKWKDSQILRSCKRDEKSVNMKVIPILIGAIGTVPKNLEKRLG